MLIADRSDFFTGGYELTDDGASVVRWSWQDERYLDISVAGQDLRVGTTGFLPTRWVLETAEGDELASTVRPGTGQWILHADGREHTFRRRPWWRRRHLMIRGTSVVGQVESRGAFFTHVDADLPLLSLPAQVFVVIVLMKVWEDAED